MESPALAPAPNYGSVSPPLWNNEDVFLVGNGPSVLNLNYDPEFTKRRVVAINNAIYNFDLLRYWEKLVFFSLDNNWIRRNLFFLQHQSEGIEKYLALPPGTWPDCEGIKDVTYLQWAYGDGLSEDSRFLNTGCHSGYAALNLAVLKGAKRIFLIGYDLHPKANAQYKFWARNYDTMLPQLKAQGVEVVNLNPDSAITAFPRREGYLTPTPAPPNAPTASKRPESGF